MSKNVISQWARYFTRSLAMNNFIWKFTFPIWRRISNIFYSLPLPYDIIPISKLLCIYNVDYYDIMYSMINGARGTSILPHNTYIYTSLII